MRSLKRNLFSAYLYCSTNGIQWSTNKRICSNHQPYKDVINKKKFRGLCDKAQWYWDRSFKWPTLNVHEFWTCYGRDKRQEVLNNFKFILNVHPQNERPLIPAHGLSSEVRKEGPSNNGTLRS